MKELNNKAHLKNKMNVKLENRNVRDMHSVHLTLTLKIHRRQCMHIDRFIHIAYISIDKSYTQWRNVWGENERLPWNTTNRFVLGQLSLILRVKLVISSIPSQRSSQAFNHAPVSGSEFCSARVAPLRFGSGSAVTAADVTPLLRCCCYDTADRIRCKCCRIWIIAPFNPMSDGARDASDARVYPRSLDARASLLLKYRQENIFMRIRNMFISRTSCTGQKVPWCNNIVMTVQICSKNLVQNIPHE